MIDDEPEVALCSASPPEIYDFLNSHKLRMRYRQQDDSDNTYWVEEPLPDLGKAMSIYIREVTTIEEDHHYFLGYAFFKLIGKDFGTPGITTKLVVSRVINNHDPAGTHNLSWISFNVYIRQDPFKETIYI